MEQEIKIPELAAFKCPSCSKTTVAEKGSKILCQECVNLFLARNVGMMEEIEPKRHLDVVASGEADDE